MIAKVQAFKTSDGTIHDNKLDALEAEYKFELRGLFQSVANANGMRAFTTSEIAQVLKAHSGRFIEVMRKNNEAIRRATAPLQGIAKIAAKK